MFNEPPHRRVARSARYFYVAGRAVGQHRLIEDGDLEVYLVGAAKCLTNRRIEELPEAHDTYMSPDAPLTSEETVINGTW